MPVHEDRELLLGGMGREVAERLAEELIGSCPVLLAVAEQDAGTCFERPAGRLGDDGRLADPGLTGDQHHLTAGARRHPLEGVHRGRHLERPTHHTHLGAGGQPAGQWHEGLRSVRIQRGPHDLDRLDGVGQALQHQAADRTAFMAAAPSRGQANDVGRQHLSAGTQGTEPSRLDDGLAEVVAVLASDLAGAQPDAQADRRVPPATVAFDSLLHRNRARHRRRRSTEHDHQSVAQVLHLGATRFSDRLAQDRHVPSAQLVGGLRRQCRRHRGRTHHVGEQDRHVLVRHPTRPPTRPSR